jgi:hypothetical protein
MTFGWRLHRCCVGRLGSRCGFITTSCISPGGEDFWPLIAALIGENIKSHIIAYLKRRHSGAPNIVLVYEHIDSIVPVMKPKPLSALDHFAAPVAALALLESWNLVQMCQVS